MKVFEIFIVSASVVAVSYAVTLKNFPTSIHEEGHGNNLQIAHQTLGVSRVEQSRRARPEERNFEGIEYRLRPAQQYHGDFEEEIHRRGHPSVTTTHIQSFDGNDDNTQLVRSGGSYVLSNSAHIQDILRSQLQRDQQQAQLIHVQTSEPRIDLPAGRRGPLYALVQNEDFQHPAAFQRIQAATDARTESTQSRSGPLHTDVNAERQQLTRQQEAQIINNDNSQRQRAQQVRILEEEEYAQPRSIQQTVEEQTQHPNIDHIRPLGNHLNARPLFRQSTEHSQQQVNADFLHAVSTGHLHRFANAEDQRRQEQEQHEQQVQTQLLLQQQLYEHHRQHALQLQELERRDQAHSVNKFQTLDEQRNVLAIRPTQEVVHSALHSDNVRQEADHSGPKFALVDYERSENLQGNERVFPNPEEVSNPTQERRGSVNSGAVSAVPAVTAEVAQATADHFNFYNSVTKTLPVLSLEETDPEAAAILRGRHGARLRHDGILVAEVE